MKHLYFFATFLVFLVFISPSFAQDRVENNLNCFSILVGRKASDDGSVLFAHNEDDWGERVVNWYKIPTNKHNSKDSLFLKRGKKIANTQRTNSYIWMEMPGLEFSDSYMNEFGVTISSDACKSKETNPELVEGGIGYWLRRLMIERATTAKEAVELGGELVEAYGYNSSGRTYCIADPYEAWMFSVVNGKHWVAQRIPDNQIAIIPNYYTIDKIDLSDTTNFLASKDLISYATEQGWYNAFTDGDFSFKKAYGNSKSQKDGDNKARHWITINEFSKEQYKFNDDFPFSFSPKKKIKLKDLFSILRNHYKYTVFDKTKDSKTGNPHLQEYMSVCSNTNQYGFVAQLRNWMPIEIGGIFWVALRRPCSNPFIPVYFGIGSFPEGYFKDRHEIALIRHFYKNAVFPEYFKGHKHTILNKRIAHLDANFNTLIPAIKTKIRLIENELLSEQIDFEKKLLKTYLKDHEKATKRITKYSWEKFELFE